MFHGEIRKKYKHFWVALKVFYSIALNVIRQLNLLLVKFCLYVSTEIIHVIFFENVIFFMNKKDESKKAHSNIYIYSSKAYKVNPVLQCQHLFPKMLPLK